MRIAATPTSVQKIAKVLNQKEEKKSQLKRDDISFGGSGTGAYLNVSEPLIAKSRDSMANKCDSNEDQE